MATQLATTTDEAPRKVAVVAGNKISAFVPNTLEEAWRLAGALAASDMTPKAYGRDQNKIMVGIMAGAEIGLTPFAALQSIAIIGNNPSVWGDGALALVRASGLMEDFEETDDGTTATCRVVRKAQSTPVIRKFSVEDAKKAGLAGKSGPWSQYPARMRQMRARAFALRDGFADVLKGMRIVEEVRDYAPMGGSSMPGAAAPLTAATLLGHDANDGTLSEQNPAANEGRGEADRGERNDADDITEMYRNAQGPADIEAADKAARTMGLEDDLNVALARSDAVTAIGGDA